MFLYLFIGIAYVSAQLLINVSYFKIFFSKILLKDQIIIIKMIEVVLYFKKIIIKIIFCLLNILYDNNI